MGQNLFNNLHVQDLFYKGYFTNVFRAFDPTRNKGVLLQIITPIFSANNYYNDLLSEYSKTLEVFHNSAFLPLSHIITSSNRIGLVYDLPIGLAEEWESFSFTDNKATATHIENCQKVLGLGVSELFDLNILHRSIRPDALVFHTESKKTYLSFFGMIENLFYTKSNQTPSYQEQIQEFFYETERLNNFNHYDKLDEYYAFSKTWYYLELLKTYEKAKIIDSNLIELKIPVSIPQASNLTILMNGSLEERQDVFQEHFKVSKIIQLEEKQEVKDIEEIEFIDNPRYIHSEASQDAAVFIQPGIKQNIDPSTVDFNTESKNKAEMNASTLFAWKKYALTTGFAAVSILFIMIIYRNLSSNEETIPNLQLVKNEYKKNAEVKAKIKTKSEYENKKEKLLQNSNIGLDNKEKPTKTKTKTPPTPPTPPTPTPPTPPTTPTPTTKPTPKTPPPTTANNSDICAKLKGEVTNAISQLEYKIKEERDKDKKNKLVKEYEKKYEDYEKRFIKLSDAGTQCSGITKLLSKLEATIGL